MSDVSNDMAQRLMERVKRFRESLGLTQEAFAERAGLKYKHYQAVEAGRKANIQFETLLKMARACGIEPWELLRFDLEPGALAEPQTPYGTDAVKKAKARLPQKSSVNRRR